MSGPGGRKTIKVNDYCVPISWDLGSIFMNLFSAVGENGDSGDYLQLHERNTPTDDIYHCQ